MTKTIRIIISLIATALMIYLACLLIQWFISVISSINPSVGAAIVAGSATIFGSVLIASYNLRMAREKMAIEANRSKKSEVYMAFMDQIVQVMRNTKAGKEGDEVLPPDIQEFFYKFTSTIVVYGGPKVIQAYAEWRSASSSDSKSSILFIDKLFRAMREDLGESNSGLDENELSGLFVIGGKRQILTLGKSK
jgi:hypothetical protein